MDVNDRVALEIGRAIMRAIIAEARAEALQAKVIELTPEPEPPKED